MTTVTTSVPATTTDERLLVEALRRGDESAFTCLVETYHPALVRAAMTYVRSRAVAEEVAQETWLGVIGGIERFEGRSSVKTWIFRILQNIAKSRGEREQRSVPFSALRSGAGESHEPAVEPERFLGPGDARGPGHWAMPPASWDTIPEERLCASETLEFVEGVIDRLPPAQREVITLRDIEGWRSEEVCEALDLSAANQRVLLHRARSRVRAALEETFFAG